MVWEEMSFEEFQDGRHGSHLRYRNGMIPAILNFCITVMPPNKFQLNLTYGLGGDVSLGGDAVLEGLGGDVV